MDSREADAVRLLVHALMGAGRFAEAEKLLAGLLAAGPDDAFAKRNLVQARLRLGRYAEAEPLARELVAEAETGAGNADARAAARFFLAHALWGCDRADESRREVERYAEEINAKRGTL